MSVEETVNRILSHCSDLTREEILKAIEDKKAASGGYLTDEAAARLVAAEKGVKIASERQAPKISIQQLMSGLNDVTVGGRVLLVKMPQTFQRPTGKGQRAWLLIGDKTGTIKVVLWNQKAEIAREVKVGHTVRVLHGYVRQSMDGGVELHVGQRGSLQIISSDDEESGFPPARDFLKKIGDVTLLSKHVNVEGTVRNLNPVSTFQKRDGAQGKVLNANIEDDTGRISVVFWDQKAEEMDKLEEGDKVVLMNVKVRKSRRDELPELHVGHLSSIEVARQA